MDLIQPKIIQSPISGQPVRPTIKTSIVAGKEVTEAIWTDPASGTFIRKGVISVKDISQK